MFVFAPYIVHCAIKSIVCLLWLILFQILLFFIIVKVADDMQRMKEEHIHLVEQMQNAYQEIEEGSKVYI